MVGKHFSHHSTPSMPSLSTSSSLKLSFGPNTPPPTYYGSFTKPSLQHYASPQAGLRIHPALSLLTYSAHLFYDVSMPPSTMRLFLLDSNSLSEPATQPPLKSMTVIHRHLPWTFQVTPSYTRANYVSIADLLKTIYHMLCVPATEADFRKIPTNEMQRRVAVAYKQRCKRSMSQGKEYNEMKRVDFLLEETIFAGLSGTSYGLNVWELNVKALKSDNSNQAESFGAQEQDQKGGGTKLLLEDEAGNGGQDYRSTLLSESSTTPPVTVSNSSSYSLLPPLQSKRGKLTKETTDSLKAWLHRHSGHPYPSEEEKMQLSQATGLSVNQVSNWMINVSS